MSLTPTGSIGSAATGTFDGSMTMPPLFQNAGQTTVNQKLGSRALPKAPVQTNDASLSARSFNERLLVGMRDNSISVGQEQVRCERSDDLIILTCVLDYNPHPASWHHHITIPCDNLLVCHVRSVFTMLSPNLSQHSSLSSPPLPSPTPGPDAHQAELPAPA